MVGTVEEIHCPGCGDDRVGDGIEECPGASGAVLTEIRDLLQAIHNGQNQLLGFLTGVNDRLMTNPLLRFGRKHG